jgi:hypothetical protein
MERQQLIDMLKNCIKTNTEYIREHNDLMLFLVQQDGKPINKRLKLPEGCELEICVSSHFNVRFPSNRTHLIGYISEPAVSAEKFKEWDACYDRVAQDNINKCIEYLIPETFENLLTTYNNLETALNQFKSALKEATGGKNSSYYNPIHYEVKRLIFGEKYYTAFNFVDSM